MNYPFALTVYFIEVIKDGFPPQSSDVFFILELQQTALSANL
jgi:hypothetical protein